MIYKIFYNQSINAIECYYFGDVTFEILKESSERRFSHEKFPEIDYLISDYSEANLKKFEPFEIQLLVSLDIKASTINPALIVLLCMPTPLEYGMARMWQAYSVELNWVSHVFSSRDELDNFIKTGGTAIN